MSTEKKQKKQNKTLPNTKSKKPVRKKKNNANNEKVSLVTGKGKSAKIKEPIDSTVKDVSMVSNRGHIDYYGHLTNQQDTTPSSSINLSCGVTTVLEPIRLLSSHENQNMDTLTLPLQQTHDLTTGHHVDLSSLRKTAFFPGDDDSDDYDPHNDAHIIPNQTIIIKDNTMSFSTTFDHYTGGSENMNNNKNWKQTDKSYMTNEIKEFPIEIIAESGYTPKYTFDIENCLKIMSEACRKNAENVTKQREEEEKRIYHSLNDEHDTSNKDHKSTLFRDNITIDGKNGALKPRRTRNNINSELNSVRIGVPFGGSNIVQTYYYNNKYKNELSNTIESFNKDREIRFEKFFLHDQLEGVTSIQKPPREFKMFRELEETYMQRFSQRINMINDSIKNTPKFLDEAPLTKQYIDTYRRRPRKTDELCSNGSRCRFKTIFKDENINYIGRVFYTPREVMSINASKKKKDAEGRIVSQQEKGDLTSLEFVREKIIQVANHEINGGGGGNDTTTTSVKMNTPIIPNINNHRKLCYDCILSEFTIKVYDNISNEVAPEKQFNHFTVLCEEGQYSPQCMLPNFANGKPTGIVGFVPRYNTHYRVSTIIQRRVFINNEVVDGTTNYIAEVGMDF